MAYHLRDKDPKNLRDDFKIYLHIESNRKASSKVGRRDDPKILKNPKDKKDKASSSNLKDQDVG
jgi:hypothetical protein